jgi:hypothetical protein
MLENRVSSLGSGESLTTKKKRLETYYDPNWTSENFGCIFIRDKTVSSTTSRPSLRPT